MLTILSYVLVPVLIVAVVASVMWVRNRQPTSLESGVDSFRREMDALSPDAAPSPRRGTESAPEHPQSPGPRRPPSADRPS